MTHDRLFRALLRLLPEELRAAYAREMELTFRDQRREASATGRWPALLALWLGTIGDLLRTAPRQHWDVFTRDAQYALRVMIRHPLHSGAAVLALALGIGANVAMFSVADAVLLAPLPYGDADRVVMVQERADSREPGNVGYLTFVDLRARARSFTAFAAASQSFATLTGDGREPERVDAMRVSASYFEVLGVQPVLGRPFRDSEDRPGAARHVAVLSDGLWRRRFGGDPSILGRAFTVNGRPHVIVGVMPPTFDDLIAERLYGAAEVWFPLGYDPAADFACRTCRHLRAFGRLAAGITADDAQREVSELLGSLAVEHPGQYNKPSAVLTGVWDVFLGPVRPVLLVVWAGVAVLLLVACASVANLLLVRASERTHEVAVRAALGVTPGRLARQLLTESLILATFGGLAGLVPAWLAIRFAASSGPSQLPRLAESALDVPALVAACLITAASGMLFGLVPLRQLSRGTFARVMHGAGRRTESLPTWRARAALAAANVAMAAFLLVGAGLLVRTMHGLLAVAPGFDPSRVVAAEVVLSGSRYQAEREADAVAAVTRFYDQVLSRLRELPAVQSASAVSTLPLGGGLDQFGLHIAGRPHANPEEAPDAHRFVVQSEFFDTLRIPLLRGRLLDRRDTQDALHVAVINRTAAEQLFPGDDPVGHRIMLGPPDAPPRTIVGVVGDLRHDGLDAPAGLQVFVPQVQWAWAEGLMTIVVRAASDPAPLAPAIRLAVHEADPLQPLGEVRGYEGIVGESIATRRFVSWLLVCFAVTAALLAVVGLYGALGVLVGLRRREIGVRLALGAGPLAVRRMVLAQGMRPAAIGLAAGLSCAALAVTALRSLLFGVAAHDPITFVGVGLFLLLAATLACLLPAIRAGRVDPAITLRAD